MAKLLFILTASVAVLTSLLASDATAKRKLPGVRIECSSLKDRYTYCRTHVVGNVRLERQLSTSRCRQYDTWGSAGDGSGIWVKDGCRGMFVVERGRRPAQAKALSITCTSADYAYNHCAVPTWGRRIYIRRQLSKTRCVQGNNWGLDWHGIWVDRGCNAEFAIQ